MRDNLLQQVYEGTIDIDTLTDEEMDSVLADFNTVATHWLESPKEKLRELAKQILSIIEDAEFVPDEKGDTLH